MKIEIWSDVVCPFCYIGKRRFENALAGFAHKDEVEVTWKSFELNPDAKPTPGKDIHDYLATNKGQTREWAKEMAGHVTQMAAELGLKYDMDRVVVANTFDAHRLIHFAAQHGLQEKAEERLFAAYFTEGKNIGDHETLAKLGAEIGLKENEVRDMLLSDSFENDVRRDEEEAMKVGVRGVPFFVFDRKFAVSGAQASETFLQVLERAWKER
jgi:predicted DsbA family dithiol-disulfide isomerase